MRILNNLTTHFRLFLSVIILTGIINLVSCSEQDPVKEDVPELITKVELMFTPVGGGAPIKVSATDPDGEGVQGITVDGSISLLANSSYTLNLSLVNELAEMSSPEYNITDEVEEEGNEHMFYFGWTENVFSDPAGDGNIDNRGDGVNYVDLDDGGLPIGLITTWTTGNPSTGTFRVILKHQPELKSVTSGVDTGETDLDVEFEVTVN